MTFWKKLLGIFMGPPGSDRGEERSEPCEGEEPFPEAVRVTDELDLHGFFPEQVGEVLDQFLDGALELGIEEVRIAHGKGRSVMKREVWKVLERDRRVAAFREAPPRRGGWGATIAFLAKREGEGAANGDRPGPDRDD